MAYMNELKNMVGKQQYQKCEAKGDDFAFFGDTSNLVNLLKQNALYAIVHCLALFANQKYKDFSEWDKFNQTFQIDLVRMATAHTYYISSMFAHNAINKMGIESDKQTIVHLKRMLRIFCLNSLLKNASTLAVIHHLFQEHYATLQVLQSKEIVALRPQILNLIESFEYDKNILISAIGSFDGYHV